MDCPRCKGTMVRDMFEDIADDTEPFTSRGGDVLCAGRSWIL